MDTIIKLQPAIKDYDWGGKRLIKDFGKPASFSQIAESWELSCQEDSLCTVSSGKDKGKPLSELVKADKTGMLGKNCEKFDDCPITIKLIDTSKYLSVKVHPNNEYAEKNYNKSGKFEVWYVLDCDKGSEIIYGFTEHTSIIKFMYNAQTNEINHILNRIKVNKGDIFLVPPGMAHAIGKGILMFEIQQKSDLNFRVYDYNRVYSDGLRRHLDIKDALSVLNFGDVLPVASSQSCIERNNIKSLSIANCEFFSSYKMDITEKVLMNTNSDSFHHLLVIDGSGIIKDSSNKSNMDIKKGDSIFVAANTGEYEIDGNCSIIVSMV